MTDPGVETPRLPARYAVERLLAEGAFGSVFLARDRTLDRPVAVKVLRESMDAEAVLRFEREARILASIEHPGVVRLFEHGVEDGVSYLVTEFLDGATLEDVAPADPLAVMLEVAGGLQAAHDQGVIHRDVKPANIFLTREGRAVLLDFGLVTAAQVQTLTRTGQMIGTPLYMAPELFRHGTAAETSDWFSWGATLYGLAAGAPPFSVLDVHAVIAGEDLPRPEVGHLPLPRRARDLVAACLREDPGARPANLAALHRTLEGRPRTPPPPPRGGGGGGGGPPGGGGAGRGRVHAGAVVALAGVVGSVVYFTRPPPAPAPPRAPGPPPAPPPGEAPFSAELLVTLREEIEDAWSHPERLLIPREARRVPPRTFERLSLFGVGALDGLAGERAVFEWLRVGGDARELAPEVAEALRAHDRGLTELGFPATFRPFLELEPAARGDLPASLDLPAEARRPPPVGDSPGGDWWRAALREADAGRRVIRQLGDEIARGDHPFISATLDRAAALTTLTHATTSDFDFVVGSLRITAEGREVLREFVAPGRIHARRFLLAASRALDTPGLPDPEPRLRYLYRCYLELRHCLIGTMLTAGRARFFGAAPRTPHAHAFQAYVLQDRRRYRRDLALPWDGPGSDPLPLLEDGKRRAREERELDFEARLWSRILLEYRDRGQLERFLREYEREQARLAPRLDPGDRDELVGRVAWARRDLGIPPPEAGR